MNNPLVSIYIPTYNRLNLLKRAVDSVLMQSYRNIEVIVVDDGSNDGTKEYLKEISNKDSRLKFLIKEGNKGAPASRNMAIFSAKGKYITGLDDDDFFTRERVRELVDNHNHGYAFTFTRKLSITDFFYSPFVFLKRSVNFDQLVYFNIVGNQVFTETSKLKAIGGFDESMPAAQDYDTWLRLCLEFGSAKILYSSSYVVDASHGHERISGNYQKKIEAYLKIREKIKSYIDDSQSNSFLIRVLLKKNKAVKFSSFHLMSFGASRYFHLMLKKMF